jgi:excisionase family DNA binding protein
MNCLLLTKTQVCERLGYSVTTIDRLRKSGLLPYRKIFNSVRFLEEDIENFITNSLATEWRSNSHKDGYHE